MDNNPTQSMSQSPAVSLPPEPPVAVDPYFPIRYSAYQTSSSIPTNLPQAPPPPPTPSLSPAPPPPYLASPSLSGESAVVYQPQSANIYMSGQPPAAYVQLQQVGQMEGGVRFTPSMSPPSGCVICKDYLFSLLKVKNFPTNI